MKEVMPVTEAVRREPPPGRLTYTCFGNVVAHVHWHTSMLRGRPGLALYAVAGEREGACRWYRGAAGTAVHG